MNLAHRRFGLDVRQAMRARAEHLISEGLARREGDRVLFRKGLLDTLGYRELEAEGIKNRSGAGDDVQSDAAWRFGFRDVPGNASLKLRPFRHD